MEQGAVHGAASSLREAAGYPLPTVERDQHNRVLDRAREALGNEAFEAAADRGCAMTQDDAVTYALQVLNLPLTSLP